MTQKEILQNFLQTLFPTPFPGFLEIRGIPREKSPASSAYVKFYPSIEEFLNDLNTWNSLNQQNYDIYFGVNPRIRCSGKKQDVHLVTSLHGDFDAKPPITKLSILTALQNHPTYPPTLIIDSGHGYHAYWTLKNPELLKEKKEKEKIETILEGLALSFPGGDPPASHIAACLRLPEFKNCKFKDNSYTTIVHKTNLSFILPNFYELYKNPKKYNPPNPINLPPPHEQNTPLNLTQTEEFPFKNILLLELQRLASAKESTRNNTLNLVAFKLGKLIPLGLPRKHVEDLLTQQAKDIGLEDSEIKATIKSGLDAGETQPPLKKQKWTLQHLTEILSTKFSPTLDEFSGKIIMNDKELPPDWINKNLLHEFELLIGSSYQNKERLQDAFWLLAQKNARHLLKELIEQQPWDGIERIPTFATDILYLNNTEYHQNVFKSFFVQIIRRIYEPGCKADGVLILIGPQRIGKSSMARILAIKDEYFLDSIMDIWSKDAMLNLTGKLIVEFSDLAAWTRSEWVRVFAFLSRNEDTYRKPYDRTSSTWKRTNVFIGTTNSPTPIEDLSGAMRFWPIQLSKRKLNLNLLKETILYYYREALQIWKEESYTFYEAPETILEEFAEEDPWKPDLTNYVLNHMPPEGEPLNTIAKTVLNIEEKYLGKHEQKRIATILKTLGCTNLVKRKGPILLRVWAPPPKEEN